MLFPLSFVPPLRWATALIALTTLSIVEAQIFEPVPSFAPAFEKTGGVISTVLVDEARGHFYLAGDFSSVCLTRGVNIGRFNADGGHDLTYFPGEVQNGAVRALAMDANGQLILGGSFTVIDGSEHRGLMRFLASGPVDETFLAGLTGEGDVRAIGIQSDGKILVGGSFAAVNGQARSGIVRLAVNGAVDATFVAPTTGGEVISALAIQPDGSILVGGSFTHLGASPVGRMARLNADGSIDGTFATGAGFNDEVLSIAVQPDGRVLVGGRFTQYGGTPAGRIARLNANGSLDAALVPGTGFNGVVRSLRVRADGRIVAGGEFTSYNGNSRPYLAQVSSTGAFDAAFGATNAATRLVNTVALQSDDQLLAGGGAFDGQGSGNGWINRFTTAGAIEDSVGIPVRQDAIVYAVQPTPEGKWIAGGDFNTVDRQVRAGIARINADGALDGTFAIGSGFAGTVRALLVGADNSVVAGGSFTAFAGVPQGGVTRLTSTGARDVSFGIGTGFNGSVEALGRTSTGRIVAGGDFTSFNGIPRGRIARLETSGALDATFDPGAGFDAVVSALLVQSDDKAIAGGAFTAVAGSARARIARLNLDGMVDATFDPGSGFNGTVHALATRSDGTIAAGGAFTQFNGATQVHVAALTTTGATVPGFSAGVAVAETIHALAPQADGKVIVGGSVEGAAPLTQGRLVRLSTTGALDATFIDTRLQIAPRHGAQPAVRALAIEGTGTIMVGGGALLYLDHLGGGLTLLQSTSLPVISGQPMGGSVAAGQSLRLTVAATSAGPLTYQWRFNGAAITGAVSAQHTILAAQPVHAGSYTVVVTDANGSTTSSGATVVVTLATGTPARLINLSARALCRTGDEVLIPGFVVMGTGTKRLLVRAVGPTLALEPFNVTGVLSNPQMKLRRLNGGVYADVASNNDWSGDAGERALIETTSLGVGAFPLPVASADAALVQDLANGQFTVLTDGVNDTEGVTIIELYDADVVATARLVNMSQRAYVGQGGDIMIAGFVISSEGPLTLLIRAVGPTLGQAPFNVSGTLDDPLLAVYAGSSPVLSNNDWGAGPSSSDTIAAAQRVGAFALSSGSQDAAIVATLNPGAYTVHVSGAASGMGIALVEVYVVE